MIDPACWVSGVQAPEVESSWYSTRRTPEPVGPSFTWTTISRCPGGVEPGKESRTVSCGADEYRPSAAAVRWAPTRNRMPTEGAQVVHTAGLTLRKVVVAMPALEARTVPTPGRFILPRGTLPPRPPFLSGKQRVAPSLRVEGAPRHPPAGYSPAGNRELLTERPVDAREETPATSGQTPSAQTHRDTRQEQPGVSPSRFLDGRLIVAEEVAGGTYRQEVRGPPTNRHGASTRASRSDVRGAQSQRQPLHASGHFHRPTAPASLRRRGKPLGPGAVPAVAAHHPGGLHRGALGPDARKRLARSEGFALRVARAPSPRRAALGRHPQGTAPEHRVRLAHEPPSRHGHGPIEEKPRGRGATDARAIKGVLRMDSRAQTHAPPRVRSGPA